MKRAGVAILAGALIAAGASAAASARSRVQDEEFQSAAIAGKLHYEVYLPDDYWTTKRRYPVVYFLHGLPSGANAYQSFGFVERALDQTGKDAILVIPQGARYNESDPEYVDRSGGHKWETAIGTELPAVIDARYRTLATRTGRAIVGLSAGGFGAMHIGIADLDRFAVIESWSGYFHPTDPTGTKALQLGPHDDVHEQLQATRGVIKKLHTTIAFYIGNGDSRFIAENRQLNGELTAAGIPHTFRVYTGGHEQRLWSQYATPWLALALGHLTPAR
jgi:S-formylglutathione hydrolase FrmB